MLRSVLVVCKGNICRSPFAAAWINQIGLRHGRKYFECRSAGTEKYHEGRGAHPLAIITAMEFGIDLSDHVAHEVTSSDLSWCDCVVVMDEQNLNRMNEKFSKQVLGKPMFLITQQLGKSVEIPDPYGKSADAFRETYEMLVRAADSFVAEFVQSDDIRH